MRAVLTAPYRHSRVCLNPGAKGAARALTTASTHAESATLNINGALKKEYEVKPLRVLVEQDAGIIQGIGPVHLNALNELGIKTIRDLADYKFYHRARAIVNLVDAEEANARLPEATMNLNKLLMKEFEAKSLSDIAQAPVMALEGITQEKARTLELQFDVITVTDLASMRYCRWAESMVRLAPLEEEN